MKKPRRCSAGKVVISMKKKGNGGPKEFLAGQI